MQKQRSPYTGGGFNLQQLKATTFNKAESLNGIPFLVQLAHQVQVQQRPHLNSSSAQSLRFLTGKKASHSAHAAYDHGQGEHDLGLRSNSSRSYTSSPNYNGAYEGELPPLPLGQTNKSNLPLGDDCCRMGHVDKNMGHLDKMGGVGHMENMENMENMANRGHMENVGHLENMNGMNNMGHMGYMNHMGHMGHVGHMDSLGRSSGKTYQSDTDSETEYCQHIQNIDVANGQSTRWRRVFDYLKSGMPAQRQERMEAALQRCCENTFFNHVLLVLQLLSILIGGFLMQSLRLGINLTQISFRLWHCKFQLRTFLRQLLWRMANAKGNDAVLFLGVMLISPWLFLISLVGFGISFVFYFKEGVGATLRQLRLQMLN